MNAVSSSRSPAGITIFDRLARDMTGSLVAPDCWASLPCCQNPKRRAKTPMACDVRRFGRVPMSTMRIRPRAARNAGMIPYKPVVSARESGRANHHQPRSALAPSFLMCPPLRGRPTAFHVSLSSVALVRLMQTCSIRQRLRRFAGVPAPIPRRRGPQGRVRHQPLTSDK
jgi:hypothetical protein